MTLLAYLLKVIVVSAILYGYYRLFLRNKRFHHYNRFFLLSVLLLSIVLPFIRIPLLYEPENPVHEVMYRTVSVINTDYANEEIQAEAIAPINESVFTLMNSIYLLYAIGVLFLMTLVFKSLLYIRSLRRRYPAEKITSLRFYNTHEPGTPFSFFRSIFWNDQLQFNSHEGQQIFRHELFHVQHQHSADRLLSEVVTAIFWFNPFFHLVKKELKAIHEFLADQFAISGSDRYTYATLLVQQALDPHKHGVTNHFFQNHIKRRIAMITEFQKSKYGYWSRVMALPLSLILFCFVTLYAKKPSHEKIAAAAAEPAAVSKEIAMNEIHIPAIDQQNDTTPARVKKEREAEMKRREIELENLRKKMIEQEETIRNRHEVELEQLKKQMMETELMARERQENRKMQQEEAMKLRRELLERKHRMNEIAREEQEKMLRKIKEHEAEVLENPRLQKENEAKLEKMKQEMQSMQNEMRNRHNAEMEMMKSRIEEIEMNKQNQLEIQNKQREELENMKKVMHSRQADIRNQQRQELQRLKDEMKSHEKEIKIREDQIKRQDEIRREQQEQIRKRVEEKRDEQEKRREDKKQRQKEQEKEEENEQKHELSYKTIPARFITDDSLMKKVIRHYMRNLRYPEVAIQNSAQGPVYFSVVVDRNGTFKDFVVYTKAPEGKDFKDIVLVTEKRPTAVIEKELSKAEKEEILKKEVERATHWPKKDLVFHPEDTRYYFKAVFSMIKQDEDSKFLLKSSSDWRLKSSSDFQFSLFQDTVPAKRALKPRSSKPAKLFKRDNEKPEPRALKAIKAPARKPQLAQHKERKVLAAKKPAKVLGKPRSPNKPSKIKSTPAKEGSGQISEDDNKEENYSDIPVSSGK